MWSEKNAAVNFTAYLPNFHFDIKIKTKKHFHPGILSVKSFKNSYVNQKLTSLRKFRRQVINDPLTSCNDIEITKTSFTLLSGQI